MLILTLRTDKPEAELGLYDDQARLAYSTWLAHRELAETIHQHIEALIKETSHTIHDLRGIVVFKGPGSFTGLRIGLSVANALAYSLIIPIVSTEGDSGWLADGISRLKQGENERVAMPEYGSPPNITPPRK